MNPIRPLLAVALLSVVAACSAGSSATPTPAPVTPPPATPAASVPATDTPAMVGPSASAVPAAELEVWRTATLTDVTTGDTFAIADFAGKLVVVEPMAAWCTSCLRQQGEAAKALAAIGSDDIVYISLGVDPTELPEDMAAYSEVRGFPWRFVIADRAVSRSLAQSLGDQVLSPPSTPKIIITPDGEVIGPSFGLKNADELEAQFRELLG